MLVTDDDFKKVTIFDVGDNFDVRLLVDVGNQHPKNVTNFGILSPTAEIAWPQIWFLKNPKYLNLKNFYGRFVWNQNNPYTPISSLVGTGVGEIFGWNIWKL